MMSIPSLLILWHLVGFDKWAAPAGDWRMQGERGGDIHSPISNQPPGPRCIPTAVGPLGPPLFQGSRVQVLPLAPSTWDSKSFLILTAPGCLTIPCGFLVDLMVPLPRKYSLHNIIFS